jgi:hypothetical protein
MKPETRIENVLRTLYWQAFSDGQLFEHEPIVKSLMDEELIEKRVKVINACQEKVMSVLMKGR